jgi:hypothetical protein
VGSGGSSSQRARGVQGKGGGIWVAEMKQRIYFPRKQRGPKTKKESESFEITHTGDDWTYEVDS